MQLFKRLLLSYFPDSLSKDSFNPASMFVSFISSKDFFTVINRKIIENYKLNFFDISMDIFEWKIWLWTQKDMLQSKMTDTYYSYIAAANFNWYKFYNIWNTANALVLLCSMYLYDAFEKSEDTIFVDALYTFYLLSFLFAARIKVFPWLDEKQDFQWFVDLYFDFYGVVMAQLKHKVSKSRISELRTKMLTHIEIFFMMFYYMRRLNILYVNTEVSTYEDDFYQWLFWPQLTVVQKEFLQKRKNIIYNEHFGEIEESLLFEIAPADIHLKYIFLDVDVGEVVDALISNIFDKKVLDKKLTLLMKNESELDFILDHVTNIDNFKKWFFKWVKQYVSHIRMQNQDTFEELDEMISEIWDDLDKLDQMQIPASLKKESKVMEQFLNFYVSYLWWLSISRADTFFLRFYKHDLVPELVRYFDIKFKTESAVSFSSLSHLLYTKNQAYYQFVNKKIREWKEKFYIPASPIKSDPIRATSFLLKMWDEIAMTTLLQDVNPKIWKLYVKNKALLDWFQIQYSDKIHELIKLSNQEFIYDYYKTIFLNFQLWENVLKVLENAFTDQDIVRLKNSLYSFDVQLFWEVVSMLPWKKLNGLYNDMVILQILSVLRETLFWFLVYYNYLQLSQKSLDWDKTFDVVLLKRVYIFQILNLDESLFTPFSWLIDRVLDKFWLAFSIFMEFDDNKEFFVILKDNWVEFLRKMWKKTLQEKQNTFSVEDLLWLRWVLKHITYYNKRYLIPSGV